jgi:hypothetical protein
MQFQEKVAGIVDWETANEIVGDISRCVDARKDVQSIVNSLNNCVENKLKPLGDPHDKKVRGQMAKIVLQDYGSTNRASFVFKLLDGKTLEAEDYKKLYYQVLKK